MNHSPAAPRAMATPWNDRPASYHVCIPVPQLNAVLLYQDPSSAQDGMRLYDRLMAALGHKYLFRLTIRNFAMLDGACATEPAAGEAVDADLVIVCTHGTDAAPRGVKEWLERWATMKAGAAGALVWLNNSPSVTLDPSPVAAFFSDPTRQNGVTLFTESGAGSIVAARRLSPASPSRPRFAIPSWPVKSTNRTAANHHSP